MEYVLAEVLKTEGIDALKGLEGKAIRLPKDRAKELEESGHVKVIKDVKDLDVPSNGRDGSKKTYSEGALDEEELRAMMTEIIGKACADQMTKAIREEAEKAKGKTPKKENAWKSMSEFAMAVKSAGTPGGMIDQRLVPSDEETKTLTGLGITGSSGEGYLMPPQFMTEMLKNVWETSEILSRCRRVPVSAQKIVWPAISETSRAAGYRMGGVRAYWVNEASQVTSSKPAFGTVTMEPHRIAALCYVSEEMLALSPVSLEPLLTGMFQEELIWSIEEAIINGLGLGQPLGVLKAPCLVEVAKETSQVADTIQNPNIVKMWARLYARGRSNAVWFYNQDCEPSLFMPILNTTVTPGITIWQPANQFAGQQFSTLMGRPMIPSEHCQTVGDAGDLILGDFSQYLVAEGVGGLEQNASIHLRFDYYEKAFRFSLLVDGTPWWKSAVTPAHGSNTVSAFVDLAARA